MFAIESILSEIADTLGKDPLDVRKHNLYRDPAQSGDPQSLTTQYGQTIEDWQGDQVIAQVEVEAKYAERRAAVKAFNATLDRYTLADVTGNQEELAGLLFAKPLPRTKARATA